jgi:hypothetical protein
VVSIFFNVYVYTYYSYQNVAPKRATSTPQNNSPMIIRNEAAESSSNSVYELRNNDAPLAPTLKPELRQVALLALGFSDRIEDVLET